MGQVRLSYDPTVISPDVETEIVVSVTNVSDPTICLGRGGESRCSLCGIIFNIFGPMELDIVDFRWIPEALHDENLWLIDQVPPFIQAVAFNQGLNIPSGVPTMLATITVRANGSQPGTTLVLDVAPTLNPDGTLSDSLLVDCDFFELDVVGGRSVSLEVCDQTPPRLLKRGEPGSLTSLCTGFVDPRSEQGGVDEFLLSFSEEIVSSNGTPVWSGDFSVVSTGSTSPNVTNVAIVEGSMGAKTVRISLDQPIPPGNWTTIEANVMDLCSNPIPDYGNLGPIDELDRIDIGFLPGDIDQNDIVSPADLFALRRIIVQGELPSAACVAVSPFDLADINRDNAISPVDVFSYRRLINGVPPEASMPWAQESLPPRP